MHYLAKSFHSAPVIALLSALLAFAPATRFAAQAVPAGTEVEEEVIEMTPFDVVEQSRDDSRYATSRTNAITGTSLPIERIPLSAQIFNQNFLDDMGVTDIGDMLVQYAGFDPQFTPYSASGALATGSEPGDRKDFSNLSIRGLPAGVQRRDGFLFSEGTTLDSFDVESVQVIGGSQSLIYGAGDAGGVLNMVGRRAKFRSNYGRARFRFDSNGSRRYELEGNVGTRRFAVTAIGVKGTQESWKTGLPRESEGWFVGVAAQPANWLTVRGEYRKFNRVEINAQSSNIRLPENTPGVPYYLRPSTKANSGDTAIRDIHTGAILAAAGASDAEKAAAYARGGLTNAEMPISNWRYIFLNEGDGFMGFNWSNIDSVFGMNARTIDHEYYSAAVEARVTRNFHLQFRWGNDERESHAQEADQSHLVFHPEYRGTTSLEGLNKPEWADHQWAYRYTGGANSIDAWRQFRSQKGFRVMGNLDFKTGGFGRHRFTFSWQTLDSLQRSIAERYYEVDSATGEFLTYYPNSNGLYPASANPSADSNYWKNAGRLPWVHELASDPRNTLPTATGIGGRPVGSTALPNGGGELWLPIYASGPNNQRWPFDQFSIPQADGSVRVFRLAPIKIPGWETADRLRALSELSEEQIAARTAMNPLGLNSTTYTEYNPATGRKAISGAYRIVEIDEDAYAGALTSEWWNDRITTMLGYRLETFTVHRLNDESRTGPSTKTSFTLGTLFDIAKWGRDHLSAYISFSSNTKAMLDLEQLDIYGAPLPFQKGLSREAGLKFSLFNRRITGGNLYFYQTNVKNSPVQLYDVRDTLDPAGVNGSHVPFVPYAAKDMDSEGFGLSFGTRPAKWWDMNFTYRYSDGRNAGADIRLPRYYNDQFHTETVGYETYVTNANGVRVQVKQDPADTSQNPAMTELTLGMMKDPDSPWYYNRNTSGSASLTDYGRITNQPLRDALREAGAGTGATGLPLSENQFGVPVDGNDTYLLSAAGEKRPGTSVHSFNLMNTFYIRGGWFNGLQLGLQLGYRHDIRAHYYWDKNEVVDPSQSATSKQRYARKLAMQPDMWTCDLSALYSFKLTKRVMWAVSLNIFNVFDRWELFPLQSDEYFRWGSVVSARPLYAPRTITVSNSVRF
jgi:hypothetical protein